MFSLKKILLSTFFLFFTFYVFSQETNKGEVYKYARKIVDTMTSVSMHGRGYVNDGDKIAANYIQTAFKKFGLKSFTDNYYQSFTFPINTFPGEVGFTYTSSIGNNSRSYKAIAGQNFLIAPASPSVNNSFATIVFDSTYTSSAKKFERFRKKIKSSNVYVIVDDRGVKDKSKLEYFKKVKANYFETAGIIELVKKLTWDQSQYVTTYVKVQVPVDSIHFSTKGTCTINIENKLILGHQSQNVIGYIKGSEHPDSFIVFSAHYDHLGQMGKDTYFPGANDNASGCAMLLNLAKYYSMAEHQPKYSIVFMAFCGEEVGLLGSKYYTENPLFPMKNIRFLLNMDIMGTGNDGITVVNGSVFKDEFDKLVEINKKNNLLKDVKIRGKAANSDHYFFSEKGIKAFFIYTMGGITAYHDIYDKAETLPLNKFEDLFKLITTFSDYLQN
jgi:aminopeptidase YwaD